MSFPLRFWTRSWISFPLPVSWRSSSALMPRLRSRRRAETASFALTVTVRGWPVAEV